MRLFFLSVILLGTLAGCATPYQSMGNTGGYQQTQIDDNTFSIQFYGNGFTSHNTAIKYAKLRAAEIGKELNFKYLRFVGEQSSSSTSYVSMPVTTSGTTYGGYSTFTSYGGVQQISKPSISIITKYYEEKPSAKLLNVHKVEELYNSLK